MYANKVNRCDLKKAKIYRDSLPKSTVPCADNKCSHKTESHRIFSQLMFFKSLNVASYVKLLINNAVHS